MSWQTIAAGIATVVVLGLVVTPVALLHISEKRWEKWRRDHRYKDSR